MQEICCVIVKKINNGNLSDLIWNKGVHRFEN